MMALHTSLSAYLGGIHNTKFDAALGEKGGYLVFSNSGQRDTVKSFTISLSALLAGFIDIQQNIETFAPHQQYNEDSWRELKDYFQDLSLKSSIQVQTKSTFSTMSKIVAWANEMAQDKYNDSAMVINADSIYITIEKLSKLVDCYIPKSEKITLGLSSASVNSLPKPFLLLAGISGTGKTRFVREQAEASRREGKPDNYCLIPVRPDWHEPSDLLGYISRIDGSRYVVTDLLRFVVSAWKDAFASADLKRIECKPASSMTPYWLCLDEMNLAPVEQYFADYLSVVETRKWHDGSYTCDPLLKVATIEQLDTVGLNALREGLHLDDPVYDGLWQYFTTTGIPLPPNLIVAGTVNMDETTHGFSRKVIDRAFTIDFGVFYPNDFDVFFEDIAKPKSITLSFPVLSCVSRAGDLANVSADETGQKSIKFLKEINKVLKSTPFELAYRALNELLLAVVCFKPENDATLQAVWDDFLMSKVLPRIDGDTEKLSSAEGAAQEETEKRSDVLTALLAVIEVHFKEILTNKRPDLLRKNEDGSVLLIDCRSREKLNWMKKRLTDNGFTTFWP